MKSMHKILGYCLLVWAAVASPSAAETWVPTGAGTYSWNATGNWNPTTIPNSVDAVANLSKDITGNQTINLNQAITVGTMTIGDTTSSWQTFTINPNGGNLTFQTSSGNASITKSAVGTNNIHDTINAPVILNSDLVAANNSSNSTDSWLVFAGSISGTGNLTIGGTTGGLVRLTAANTFNGTTSPTGGRLQLAHSLGLQNSTYIPVTGGNGFVFRQEGGTAFTFGGLAGTATGGQANLSLQNSASQAVALSVGNNNASTSYAANLTGNGSLVKIGTGTLTLGGNHTYVGTTTVSNGTLRINGSTSASSVVSVGVNGTLGGNGTIGGATTILGTHAPGNSPGVQTFANNLTYSGGNSTVQWELVGNTTTNTGNATYDQVIVGGNLDFANATTLNLVFNGAGSGVLWSNGFWGSNQTWTLYDVAGSTTNNSSFTINPGSWQDSGGTPLASSVRAGSSFFLSQSGSDIVLNYVAVPEPSTIALAVLGCVGAGMIARRRR